MSNIYTLVWKVHPNLLTNKLQVGFTENYAQFFYTFSFKSGQTKGCPARDPLELIPGNWPSLLRDVYICPVKFNLIKGQTRAQPSKGVPKNRRKSISAMQARNPQKGDSSSANKKKGRKGLSEGVPQQELIKAKRGWCTERTMHASVLPSGESFFTFLIVWP